VGYADHFAEADVLDTLSWVTMTLDARIAKIANLYLKDERRISAAHRNYGGPTMGTVRVFTKSLYAPPRGQGQTTYQKVLAEIPRQRAIRAARECNRPWTFSRPSKKSRINAVSKRRYTTLATRWRSKKKVAVRPDCIGITRIAGCRIIADGGDTYPDSAPRFWIQHAETGRAKVVVLKGRRLKSITQMLTQIAPKKALRGMFGGVPIRLDFDAEAFEVEGELVPWRNIIKVYSVKRARKPIKTEAEPEED
jgi:hypothetical protein